MINICKHPKFNVEFKIKIESDVLTLQQAFSHMNYRCYPAVSPYQRHDQRWRPCPFRALLEVPLESPQYKFDTYLLFPFHFEDEFYKEK